MPNRWNILFGNRTADRILNEEIFNEADFNFIASHSEKKTTPGDKIHFIGNFPIMLYT